jgi:hypothetical protein
MTEASAQAPFTITDWLPPHLPITALINWRRASSRSPTSCSTPWSSTRQSAGSPHRAGPCSPASRVTACGARRPTDLATRGTGQRPGRASRVPALGRHRCVLRADRRWIVNGG